MDNGSGYFGGGGLLVGRHLCMFEYGAETETSLIRFPGIPWPVAI